MCFHIGMDRSWVMTENERKAMMKARAEKKLKKQLESKSIDCYASDDTEACNIRNDYEPQVDRIIEFLNPAEINEIESIVTNYICAYHHVPYRTESSRTGDEQLIEVRIHISVYLFDLLYFLFLSIDF